jgi:acyl-CoA reductase-like NAD-dependent aldehyde dehydrogenase
MTQREVITEAMLQAAIAALDKRIAMPSLPAEKRYSRREAFAKLRGKAKEALAAGHTLETVLDDLKGVGLGMTISTARQYLKPGRRISKARVGIRLEAQEKPLAKTAPAALAKSSAPPVNTVATKKGTFTVIEDDKEI